MLYWPFNCYSCHMFLFWFLVPVIPLFPSCMFLIQSHCPWNFFEFPLRILVLAILRPQFQKTSSLTCSLLKLTAFFLHPAQAWYRRDKQPLLLFFFTRLCLPWALTTWKQVNCFGKKVCNWKLAYGQSQKHILGTRTSKLDFLALRNLLDIFKRSCMSLQKQEEARGERGRNKPGLKHAWDSSRVTALALLNAPAGTQRVDQGDLVIEWWCWNFLLHLS